MTTRDGLERFERDLSDLLDELGAPRIPDYVNDLFTRTVATRQRPRWTFLERWLPMGVLARRTQLIPSISLRPIAVVLLLIAALVAAALIAGRAPRLPPPFGVAANGQIAYDRNGDIFVRDTLTSQERLVVGGPTNDFAAGFLRNGTKLTFLRTVQEPTPGGVELLSLVIADLDGSHQVAVTGGLDSPDWADVSPDDRTFVVQLKDANIPSLFLFDTSGSGTLTKLPIGQPAYTPSFRGPDGREIVFRGWVPDTRPPRVSLFAIRPDGTGLRQLTTIVGNTSGDFDSPALSPDGRLAAYSRRTADGFWRIHILDLETGVEREFHVQGWPPAHHGYATFSPDGTQLLFHYITSTDRVQPMVAPVDERGPALAIGSGGPVINGSAELSQSWSPDGRSVIVSNGKTRETRIVDAATGGDGTVIPWAGGSFGSWQRLAP